MTEREDVYPNRVRDNSNDKIRKQQIRDERLANGLCPRCGKEPALNDGLGSKCRAYGRRYRELHRPDISRSEWASYGRCYICGCEGIIAGKKVCPTCYEQRMVSMQRAIDTADRSYWKSLHF